MKLVIVLLSVLIAKSISDINNTKSDPNDFENQNNDDSNSSSNKTIGDDFHSNDTLSNETSDESLRNETSDELFSNDTYYGPVGVGRPMGETIEQRSSLRVRDNYYKTVLCVDYALNLSIGTSYACSAMTALMSFTKLRLGASGRTRMEIDKILGSKDKYWEKVLSFFTKYLSALHDIKDYIFACSQVFIDDKLKLTTNVNATMARVFGRDTIQSIHMTNPKDVSVQLNNWVRDIIDNIQPFQMQVTAATLGKIKNIVNPLEIKPTAKGVIVLSAIDFKANWATQFNILQLGTFNGETSSTTCVMMSLKTTFNYYYSTLYQSKIIVVPFTGPKNALKFIVVLPDNGLHKFHGTLRINPDKIFDDIYKNVKQTEVSLTLPRFNITSSIVFDKVLQTKGFHHMYDDKCRRSGITDLVEGNELYVRTIKQKAHIFINEFGAMASSESDAYPLGEPTAVKEDVTSGTSMKCDRPFYFYVEAQGYIVLSGAVANMEPI